MRQKVLLFNPPWKNNRIIREYNCSHTSKSSYILPPLDLLEISGIVAKEHEVAFIDCVVERLDPVKAYRKVTDFKPDWIIALTSVLSFKRDLRLLNVIKEKLGCQILLMGDITYFRPRMIMERFPFVRGIIFDFTSEYILDYLNGKYKNVKNMVFRKGERIIFTEKDNLKEYFLPLPKYELFPLKKYNLPYGRYKPFSSILASYGCPYKCSFCVSGKMPYKQRNLDNFMEELHHLKNIGIKEIFIRDSAFNGNLQRSKDICKQMIDERISLPWSCDMTSINCDLELLKLMKKSGCFLVMVGVETANDDVLKITRKPLSFDLTKNFFKMCKEAGIATLGHFIIGLPNDTEESINNTIRFAKEIGCDYASFNLYVPRIGSDLRKDLIKNKKITKEDLAKLDCSTDCVAIILSKDKLLKLKNKAIFEFYFRPSQILKQFYLIKTWVQFLNLIKNGYQIFLEILIVRNNR